MPAHLPFWGLVRWLHHRSRPGTGMLADRGLNQQGRPSDRSCGRSQGPIPRVLASARSCGRNAPSEPAGNDHNSDRTARGPRATPHSDHKSDPRACSSAVQAGELRITSSPGPASSARRSCSRPSRRRPEEPTRPRPGLRAGEKVRTKDSRTLPSQHGSHCPVPFSTGVTVGDPSHPGASSRGAAPRTAWSRH